MGASVTSGNRFIYRTSQAVPGADVYSRLSWKGPPDTYLSFNKFYGRTQNSVLILAKMIVSIVHQTLTVLLGVLLFARCGCGEPVQFCRMGAYDRSDSCIALSSFYNGTSHSYNLNMHFSVKFEGDEGWASIGTGDTMEDSLMFIIYPSRDKKGSFNTMLFS